MGGQEKGCFFGGISGPNLAVASVKALRLVTSMGLFLHTGFRFGLFVCFHVLLSCIYASLTAVKISFRLGVGFLRQALPPPFPLTVGAARRTPLEPRRTMRLVHQQNHNGREPPDANADRLRSHLRCLVGV